MCLHGVAGINPASRSSLKVAEVELAAARNHVQQFKDISQASEVALSSLSTTYDDYKATSEAQLAMREVCGLFSPMRYLLTSA